MATQDNNPGLLSKMARFVLNPTKNWTELNEPDSMLASDFGKESLKLVIEGKRRDDAIRKREFHQLRKLRQASPTIKSEQAQGSSVFRSSTGYGDSESGGRSSTLKKIDEIEAQMSRQWWKGSGSGSGSTAGAPSHVKDSKNQPPHTKTTFPVTLQSNLSTSTEEPSQIPSNTQPEFQPTVPGQRQLSASSDYATSTHNAFSPSKMVSLDIGQNLSDPELEEAAIRYANGDDVGAEAALQEALQQPGVSQEKAIHWTAALLDLYRCIGQQTNFERMALEYAQRFDRSPPSWLALQKKSANHLLPTATGESLRSEPMRWVANAEIDEASLIELRHLVRSSAVSYVLDWRQTKTISTMVANGLGILFDQWCKTPLSLSFEGEEVLIQVLQTLTPSNDKTISKDLWQLRFDALRMLGLQDDYEMAALDFCVTFELSPPPWRDPVCRRVDISNPLQAQDTAQDTAGVFTTSSSALSLSREVLGDISGLVAQWQSIGSAENTLVISCAQLIRVDFSAAGGLLNWVANLSTQGREVEFHEVPRLVAAFFNLIGINEHARVLTRDN
ncbi:MAG: STAS domain-containing protein [Rhodoferax sp.]|nr:STAS domain-containing protein [Rhodoferax sp.]